VNSQEVEGGLYWACSETENLHSSSVDETFKGNYHMISSCLFEPLCTFMLPCYCHSSVNELNYSAVK